LHFNRHLVSTDCKCTIVQVNRHGLQLSRKKGTDYNRADERVRIANPRQLLWARRSQICASKRHCR